MKLEGTCDFCGTEGKWEGGLFGDRSEVKSRPKNWAALFPVSVEKLPDDCTFRPEDLEKHNITTACACPKCVRRNRDSFEPKARS